MNLKDLIKVKVEKEQGIRVPWDEKGEVGFIISYCGRDVIVKARKAALKTSFNYKSRQYDELLDDERFDYEIMKSTIVGWWGLKAKHLAEILDPSTTELVVDEKELEQEIPYTPESRDILIKNYNLTFSRFISAVSMDIEEYRKCKEEALRKKLIEVANWSRIGGLKCNECRELVELGVKELDCNSCDKPTLMEENKIIFKIYEYRPITPIPMTDGLVMLDLNAVKFLMDVFKIDDCDRESVLDGLMLIHDEIYKQVKK